MKSFKRTTTIACVIVMLCLSILGGCNCSLANYTNYKFETDGTYYYHLEENGYYVAGLKDETQEVLYIPAYFKNEPVVEMGVLYSSAFMAENRYSTIMKYDLKKIYYPYTMELDDCAACFINDNEPSVYKIRSFAKETFFICMSTGKNEIQDILEEYYRQTKKLNREIVSAYAYVAKKMFEDKYSNEKEYKYKIEEFKRFFNVENYEAFIQMANTAYFFNYEEAPNEGYFFINNFEYGSLIEDTPYKPIREGYEFAGWYKEPECVNKWDFEKDRLHEEKYDEEGNFVFEELGLYAKWTKK